MCVPVCVCVQDVLHMFCQLVLGMQNIHNSNILHRDIKSNNILLDRSHRIVKIGDFGISKILSRCVCVCVYLVCVCVCICIYLVYLCVCLPLQTLNSSHLMNKYYSSSFLKTLSKLNLPYLILPNLTLPYHTIPYHTIPYLTLPYLTLPNLT